MGSHRFGAPRELIDWMRKAFSIRYFVETGTNKAETAVWASQYFDRVLTIEGYEQLYKEVSEQYHHLQNIDFHLGDSASSLSRMLNSLDGIAIVWLDAHWCSEETFGKTSECPLMAELQCLNEDGRSHIILVDDARLFLKPPPPPHRAADWPDIGAVCDALTRPIKRYVAVHEDVIIAVRDDFRNPVIEYLRRPEPAASNTDRDEPLGLARAFRRLRRALR